MKLTGKTIAVLATDGFEESELCEPLSALREAGASYHVIAPKRGEIKGWKGKDWSGTVSVHRELGEVSGEEYDGLLIPGGTLNCDKLRMEPKAIELTREFFAEGKPVCAICHGPQILIEADVVQGRRMTSYRAIRTDLINAGAEWIDAAVVVDNGLVTSRTPEDLPHFIPKMLEEFQEGIHRPAAYQADASTRM